MSLCGHGTLATAAALIFNGNENCVLGFKTLSGTLEVKKPQDLASGLFMDFPSYPTRPLTTEENAELSSTIDFFGLQKETSDLQISLGKLSISWETCYFLPAVTNS